MLVFALLTCQFIKICCNSFLCILILRYSKINAYYFFAPCKSRYPEKKKRVNIEENKIKKYGVKEPEKVFNY